MSLRAFHVVFIALSVALSAMVSAWGVQEYRTGGGIGALVLAGAFFIVGMALVVYGSRYFSKLKELR